MSKEESLALLRASRLARLGCVADGEPYVVPVNYVFDDECAISHSLPGRKITAMRAHPRVCLQVDEVADQFHWKSVLAYGTFEELKNPDERARALGLLLSLFPRLTPVESFIAGDASAPAPIAYRIRIDRVTGIMEG
ncbi:MAG TPA: pyridoxamine 5'-phosphate oxidase family protein [Pyrinomonadaceae bacterium]|nr:pyridoxamine 5'-phosphate oxidase family protein [Pyrinomonadaceae bacterium]